MKQRLYFLFPHWFLPAATCSWCRAMIRRGGFFARGKMSHGICVGCKLALRSTRERV